MALIPGTRLGPYAIAAQIGVGMGEVYRATDTNLGRDVAIKVLPESVAQDPERLARFDREARTLAALNHPNIAQIHGLEQSDGNIALVMELVEGPTLADRPGCRCPPRAWHPGADKKHTSYRLGAQRSRYRRSGITPASSSSRTGSRNCGGWCRRTDRFSGRNVCPKVCRTSIRSRSYATQRHPSLRYGFAAAHGRIATRPCTFAARLGQPLYSPAITNF